MSFASNRSEAIKPDPCELKIRGTITSDTVSRFKKSIAAIPPDCASAKINLSSPGGSVASAIEIGQLIRQMGLETHITTGACASACTLIFFGGQERTLSTIRGIEVHQLSVITNGAKACIEDPLGPHNKNVLNYLTEMLGDKSGYLIHNRMMTTSCYQAQNIDPIEAINLGIVTRWVSQK
jgi:hypothetical protein